MREPDGPVLEGSAVSYNKEDGDRFDLTSARNLLAYTEHLAHDQTISDSLWVELRMACNEVERLLRVARNQQEVIDDSGNYWNEDGSLCEYNHNGGCPIHDRGESAASI